MLNTPLGPHATVINKIKIFFCVIRVSFVYFIEKHDSDLLRVAPPRAEGVCHTISTLDARYEVERPARRGHRLRVTPLSALSRGILHLLNLHGV